MVPDGSFLVLGSVPHHLDGRGTCQPPKKLPRPWQVPLAIRSLPASEGLLVVTFFSCLLALCGMTLGESLHPWSPFSQSWMTPLTRSRDDLQKALSVLVTQMFPANVTAAGTHSYSTEWMDDVPGAY